MAHLRCDFRSEVLDMGTSMTVFLPESLDCRSVNVVYLLHGLADNCTGWARYTNVERYARSYNTAVVIPEVQRSFYSSMLLGLDYFTFVHDELPQICANMFGLSRKRELNYIMGLSMGGYGAIKSVLRSPERYCGCASFSAVTDLKNEIPNASEQRSREYKAMFGLPGVLPTDCDLFKMLDKADSSTLPVFYMACGAQDTLLQQNESFAESLKEKGADCTFEKWDGIHSWDFWDVAVKKAFDKFFGR